MDYTNSQDQDIAELSYAIWETEGRPEGNSMDYWLSAEFALRELNFNFQPLDISIF